MSKYVTATAAVLVAGLVSGCSWLYGEQGLIHDSQNDYTKATVAPALRLPDGQPFKADDQYMVPAIADSARTGALGEALDMRPPALVLATAEGVHAIQDKTLPTAIIVTDSAKLAAELQAFLSLNEINVKTQAEQPVSLHTDWVVGEEIGFFSRWLLWEDTLALRWQYRFSVNAGERPNEQVLTVEAVAMARQQRSGDWAEQTAERRHATVMLNRFLGFHDELQVREARARVLAARAGIETQLWEDENGNAGLLATARFDHTWDATPAVFALMGFELDDKDTTKHLYYFRLDEDEGEGFWSSLFDWSSSEEDRVRIALKPGEYLVQLSEQGDNTGLLLSEADGSALSREKMAEIYPALSAAFKERRPASVLEQRR